MTRKLTRISCKLINVVNSCKEWHPYIMVEPFIYLPVMWEGINIDKVDIMETWNAKYWVVIIIIIFIVVLLIAFHCSYLIHEHLHTRRSNVESNVGTYEAPVAMIGVGNDKRFSETQIETMQERRRISSSRKP